MLATLAIVAVAILAFSFYVGRNVGSAPGTAPTPTPAAAVSAASCGALTFGPVMAPTAGNAGKKTFAAPPPMSINTTHHFLATIKTAKGTMTLCLDPTLAPSTVNNFVFLARNQFYDGLKFHRVEANFVIQGGSPGANEYVGDASFMRDEVGTWPHVRGAVGISTRGHDTGDAQIFIDLVDNPRLDHQYTVFAQVLNGIEVVDQILEGDVIESIQILTS